MARIFITGSADGLGHLAAKELVSLGHEVVLHARNKERAKTAMDKIPGAKDLLIADLSGMEETKALASQANALGTFDAVIHNAGVYQVPKNSLTVDGLSTTFAVNTLAPYILTCLMHKPKRLVYLGSDMHLHGDTDFKKLLEIDRIKNVSVSYSDTKLHDVMFAFAVARLWPEVVSNAVDPGWVPTKMGGAGAPDNLEKGYQTQVWLAVSEENDAMISGRYLHHKKPARVNPAAKDIALQDQLILACGNITGISFSVNQ